jgi:hypothetical protein
MYAAQILAICIQSFAKFSVVLMMERIAAELSSKRSHLALKLIIGSWVLFSLLTVAFQCGIPQPWRFARATCAAQGRLDYVIIVGNIVTDAILACYFIPIVWKLQMSRSLKILVSFLFGLRLV